MCEILPTPSELKRHYVPLQQTEPVVQGSNDKDNEEKVCRVCLSLTKRSISLFETYLRFTPLFIINLLSDTKISEHHNLPSAICQVCLSELQIVINFKRKSEQSESLLRSSNIYETSCIETVVNSETEQPVKQEIEEENVDSSEIFYDNDYPTDSVEQTSMVDDSRLLKNFQCDDCKQFFNTKCKLKMHWKRSHEPKSYTCNRCKRLFKSSSSFRNHNLQKESCTKKFTYINIEGVGKNRVFCCELCDYKSKFYPRLKTHVVRHTGEKPFQCTLCQKSYSQRNSLIWHTQNVHPDSNIVAITCYICAKSIKGSYRYANHLRRAHQEDQYQCDTCKIFLKTKLNLICHLKRHANLRQYVCDVCGESFNVNSALCNHRKRHEGLTYNCDQCGYRAKKKYSVYRHTLLHKDEKLSQCPQCYRFYESPLKLYKHIRGHHGKASGELHYCPICSKGFSRKTNCIAHEKNVHHKVKCLNINEDINKVKEK